MNNKLENENISSHILFPSVSVHYSIVETFICRVNNISSAKPKMLLFHSSKIEGSNWLFFLFGSYISIYLYLYIYIYIYLSISLYKYIYIYIYIILYICYLPRCHLALRDYNIFCCFPNQLSLISQLCLHFFEKLSYYTFGNKNYSKKHILGCSRCGCQCS